MLFFLYLLISYIFLYFHADSLHFLLRDRYGCCSKKSQYCVIWGKITRILTKWWLEMNPKYDKDSNLYFRNLYVVILGEMFLLRGRPKGLPLSQNSSPSFTTNKYLKKKLESILFGIISSNNFVNILVILPQIRQYCDFFYQNCLPIP